MTAEERFDLAARAAFICEQAQSLREDVEKHYRDASDTNYVVAAAAWWSLGQAVHGMERATETLVDAENPIPSSEAA